MKIIIVNLAEIKMSCPTRLAKNRSPLDHHARPFLLFLAAIVIGLLQAASLASTHAQAASPPITPSGLNTQVSAPLAAAGGKTQYDITGGTYAGTNLFQSFGQFNVPNNNIANFLNDSGLATSNILGRVTGGNISNIFGTIQTTGFGNANLFLMNPAGFLFGPNATVNVGGTVAFTSADYLRLADGVRFNAIPNAAADALLSAAPVAAFGFLGSNPGAITVQGSQLSVADGTGIALVGGNITIQSGTRHDGTVQTARLSAPNGKIQLASASSPGEFDAITLQSLPNVDGTSFTSFGSAALALGSTVNVSGTNTVSIRDGLFVLSVNDATLSTSENPAPADTILLSPGSSIVTSNSGAEPGADVQIATAALQMDAALVTSRTTGEGAGGNIFVNANSVTLQNGGTLSAKTSGTEATATGGTITVNAYQLNADGATITVETTGAGNAGQIALITQPAGGLTADAINLTNSIITNSTSSNANAGDILLQTESLHVDNTFIASDAAPFPGSSFTGGNAGTIQAQVGGDITLTNSILSTSTGGNGNAGNILLASNNLQAESSLLASTANASPGLSGGNGGTIQLTIAETANLSNTAIDSQTAANGNAGNIFVTANSLTLATSQLSTGTSPGVGFTGGNAGNIQVTVGGLIMNDGLIVSQSLFSAGNGGTVTINASESIMTSGTNIFPFAISTSTDGAAPFCPGACGNAGNITVTAPTFALNGVGLNSTTTGQGNAGNILVKTGNFTIVNGAQISASAEGPVVTGAGGTVTIQGLASPAQSVLIDGAGSGIFTDTQGTGAGGNITLNANTVTLQNSGMLSAKTSGTEATATGGTITVTATNQVAMTGGASITASSTGPADAGNISINAGQQLDMRDSSIKTEAAHASGGNIDIQAVDRVRLVNSTISASVLGGSGSGGNITVDPNVVSLQNNSQMIAQAIQGAGGNITITTSLFLVDQTSLVSASSQFGLNGTVTILSPTSNLSGSVGSLPSSIRQQLALQAQRCAAQSGGASSSFIIAGRDTIPTEPGGWLASPLGLHSLDRGPLAETTVDEERPTPLVMAQTSDTMSLRRLTPAGFLTQRFAGNGSDGC